MHNKSLVVPICILFSHFTNYLFERSTLYLRRAHFENLYGHSSESFSKTLVKKNQKD